MENKSKLTKIRESVGLSLYKVAKELSLDWHTLDSIEKGTVERVSLIVLKRVKDYYSKLDSSTSFDDIINDIFMIKDSMEKKRIVA